MKYQSFSKPVLLLLLLFTAANLYASFPTNTNVTAVRQPISPGNPNQAITISTFDSQRNQTFSWTSGPGQYSNPTVQDGMVSWATTSPNLIFNYAVYDPRCGCWKFYNINTSGLQASITRGGIIGWEVFRYPLGSSTPNIEHNFGVYDPEIPGWVFNRSLNTQRNSGGFIVSETMTAWAEILYPTGYPTNPAKITFFFSIYDPLRKNWSTVQSNQFNAGNTSYQIQNGTGVYTVNGVANKFGYNINTGTWISGVDTLAAAYFVTSRDSATAPAGVYFWDMSLGGSSWSWTFGDGGSSAVRSPFYSYSTPFGSPFTVTQTVSGPSGTNSASKSIVIN